MCLSCNTIKLLSKSEERRDHWFLVALFYVFINLSDFLGEILMQCKNFHIYSCILDVLSGGTWPGTLNRLSNEFEQPV